MNFITFKTLGRTLLLAAALAVGSVCWLGCGGDDNPSGGNNNSVNTTHTHTWGDWVVTTEPTCDKEGVKTRICTQDASHKETQSIPKLTGAACNGGGNNTVANNNCGKNGTADSCKTVVIGEQTWMVENLNRETPDSWCYYNSADSCNKYGRLYTWAAAKTACPNGWHLPTRDEWGTLAKAAGGTGTYGDGGTAGTKLKSTSGWYDNGNGTDSLGFSALPGGARSFDGYFSRIGDGGLWWTATEYGIGINAYYRYMSYEQECVRENFDAKKENAFLVRCLEDD